MKMNDTDYYVLYYDPDNIDLDIVDDIYKKIKESLTDNITLAMLPSLYRNSTTIGCGLFGFSALLMKHNFLHATWLKAYGKDGYKDALMYCRDLIDKELERIDD